MIKPQQLRNNLFIVRGKDSGLAAWHILLVDKLKLILFERAVATGTLDVADFGQVLKSGWGENPPEDVVEKIKEQY